MKKPILIFVLLLTLNFITRCGNETKNKPEKSEKGIPLPKGPINTFTVVDYKGDETEAVAPSTKKKSTETKENTKKENTKKEKKWKRSSKEAEEVLDKSKKGAKPNLKDKIIKNKVRKINLDIPSGLIANKYIKNLHSGEINLIRAKIYAKYGYDFYSVWGKNFYKSKYGYISKASNKVYKRLNRVDKANEDKLKAQLIKNYKRSLKLYYPIYTGHILREINYSKVRQKYFEDIKDLNPVVPEGLPRTRFGISKPKFGKQIRRTSWELLIKGHKNFNALKIPLNRERVYLVLYYYKSSKIKYIVGYDAFVGHIGPQDAKHFSFYDFKGALRRHISIGTQEVYESDYMYKDGKMDRIIEQIINDKSIKVNIYKIN